MMRRVDWQAVLGMLGVAVMTGLVACQPPAVEHSGQAGTYPADFSLVFTVEPMAFVPLDDPLREPFQYVVEADRTLRAARGLGAHHGLYPPPTATLEPREMAGLYELVRAGGLLEADDQPLGQSQVRYHIAITLEGETHRLLATPEASPGAVALLRRLVTLRGG